MLRYIFKTNQVLVAICAILLAVNGCSSTADTDFDDPMGLKSYDEQQDENSEVIDEYSDSYQDEGLGYSEITSPDAVDEALYAITQPEGENYYDDTAGGMAASLDDLTIPQDIDTLSDSEPYLPDYKDGKVAEVSAIAPVQAQSASSASDDSSPSTNTRRGKSETYGEYIVQPDDTLGGIAFQVLGTSQRWRELSDLNNISDPTQILPGDIIRYPLTQRSEKFQALYAEMQMETVTVQAGDTLSQIAERVLGRHYYWRTMWRFNADLIPDPNRLEIGQTLRYVDPRKLHSQLSTKGGSRFGH